MYTMDSSVAAFLSENVDADMHVCREASTGVTALTAACACGSGARLLLGRADAEDILMIACAHGHTRCVRSLLAQGHWDPERRSAFGLTALMLCCERGHADCAGALIRTGADVQPRTHDGFTALLFASMQGSAACIDLLLAAGADPDAPTQDGSTALMACTDRGHAQCARALLAAGADANRTKRNGVSALMMACHFGHAECARALLGAGAHASCRLADGVSPLLLASEAGQAACVRALLCAGASVAEAKDDGVDALMLASKGAHTECVELLVGAGADVRRANSSGVTALMLACSARCVAAALAILSAGADAAQADLMGRDALWWAPNLEVAQALCVAGASREQLFAQDEALGRFPPECAAWLRASRRWCTPLHHLELLSAERARWLLASGADILAAAADGGADERLPTPLSRARELLAGGRRCEAAQLVVDASLPWSPQSHALFPPAARARAAELLLLGHALSREERFEPHGGVALTDCWVRHVLAHAVSRSAQ